MDQIYEETDPKFEEIDQQIEIFKIFEKSGNGSNIWGNGPIKFEETADQKYEETYQFKSFWKKRKRINKNEETDQKYWVYPQKYWEILRKYLNKIKGKRIYILGNRSKKIGNSSKFEFRGISEKFEEIAEMPLKNRFLRGFRVFLIRFRCWVESVLRRFHVTIHYTYNI